MKVLTDLNFQLHQTAVCIGKFDGLHRGHRLLFHEAEKSGLPLVMITFLFPQAKGIYSYEEKKFLAERLGFDILVAIPVTKAFMQMSAEQFVKDVLVGKCDARNVVVGTDFCFGCQRQGTARYLKEQGGKYGFDVAVMEKLRQDGEIISSTGIRSLLAEGQMERANALLQTPYFIRGNVEGGNRIGRRISVPTANIKPSEEKVLPPFGVYAVRTETGGQVYDGVANLGVKPTIPGKNPAGLEVWLFDYDGNLYDRELTVYLYSFQRRERAFASVDKLREQIVLDTGRAKEILANTPFQIEHVR